MSSTYTIQSVRDDETLELDTRSDKQAAIKVADEYHLDHTNQLVQVVTEAGTVVHEVAPLEVAVTATDADEAEAEVTALVEADASDEVIAEAIKRAKPWSRTEEATFPVPTIEGATLAYVRKRIKTAVYRKLDKSGWIILDTRDGSQWETPNTEEGREITNRLTKENLEQVKAARAEAKAAKDQARSDAKAAKAAADAAAKAEKDAAKAQKLAEKEAAAAAAEAEAESETVDA